METQCVFCCVRNAFLCTFKLWVFKVVSALQAGDITLEAVLSFSSASLPYHQCADFLTSDCDSPPWTDVTLFRSVALSSRTLRLSDTIDGAVNDLFLWRLFEEWKWCCYFRNTLCACSDRYSAMVHAPAGSSGRFALRLENCISADISFLRSS